MSVLNKSVLITSLICLAYGCGDRDTEADTKNISNPKKLIPTKENLLQRVAAFYKPTNAFVASAHAVIERMDGSSVSFEIDGWLRPSGTLKLEVSRLGIPVVSFLIEPDGKYQAFLPRENMVFAGTLQQLVGTKNSTNPYLWVNDLKGKPIPYDKNMTVYTNSVSVVDNSIGEIAIINFTDEGAVKEKTWYFFLDGKSYPFKLAYSKYTSIDGVNRPGRLELGEYGPIKSTILQLKYFNKYDQLNPEKFKLRVRKNPKQISADEFFQGILDSPEK
jgi:hypothetical protein